MKALSKKPQIGDTIIEVLVAMSILALVLTGAYESTSRSLQNGVDSSNRQRALGLAEQQIEVIKNSSVSSQAALGSYQSAPGTAFCIDSTNLSSSSYGKNAANNSKCQQLNGSIINLSDVYNNGLFTISANWPSSVVGGSHVSQATLYYRVPTASAPAPPPVGGSGGPPPPTPPPPTPPPPTVTVIPTVTVMSHPNLILRPKLTIFANGSPIWGPHTYGVSELTTKSPSYSTTLPSYTSDYDRDEVRYTFTYTISGVPPMTTLTFDFENDQTGFNVARSGCSVGDPKCFEDNNIIINNISIPGHSVTFSSYGPGHPAGVVPLPAPGNSVGPYNLWMSWSGTGNFNVTP